MATPAKSTKYTTIGTQSCSESNVLVDSTAIDVDANIDFSVLDAKELEVVIVSATTVTGAPSIVFTLQRWNPAGLAWETLVASTALAAAGMRRLLVGPNVAVTANVSAQAIVGEKMRLVIDYTGTPVTDVLNGTTVAVYVS